MDTDIRECRWCGKKFPFSKMYECWDWLACQECWNEMQSKKGDTKTMDTVIIDEGNRKEIADNIAIIQQAQSLLNMRLRTILMTLGKNPEDKWILSDDCSTLTKKEAVVPVKFVEKDSIQEVPTEDK